MSAFASLTLQNNAAANVVFTPQSIDGNGVAKWMGPGSSLDSKTQVTMSVSIPKNGGTVSRVKQKIMIPIMDSVDTTKKVAEAYVTIEAVLPKLASSTTALDLRAHAKTLLDNAVSTAAYQNTEAIY